MFVFIINATKNIHYSLVKQVTQPLLFSEEGPKFMGVLTLENFKYFLPLIKMNSVSRKHTRV